MMNGDDDEDIAEIHGVDPTPIDHPVDDEAIASAVNAAAEDVASQSETDEDPHPEDQHHPTMYTVHHDDHDLDISNAGIKEHPGRTGPNDESLAAAADGANTTDVLLPASEQNSAPSNNNNKNNNENPKQRARRVGKVPVVRKVPKLEEPSSGAGAVDPTISALEGTEPVVPMSPEVLPRVLSKHDEKWNAMFKDLVEFKVCFCR